MKIIHISTKEQLDSLYNESALTWEGLSTEKGNLDALKEWLNHHGAILADREPTIHIISGEFMNAMYSLRGNNAYPDDLTIVSVTDINQAKVTLPRFEVGGRWFDDIVDNNKRREE